MTAILHPPANVGALAAPPVARVRGAALAINPVIRAAFYLFIFSIPFEMPRARTIPLEIPTVTALIFLASTVLQPSACYRRLPGPVLFFGAYLWMFVTSWYVNQVEARGEVIKLFATLCLMLLLLWAMVNVLSDTRVMKGLLLSLIFACTIRAMMPILGIATKQYHVMTGGVRTTTLGQNLNLSAMILAAGLVMVVGLRIQAVKQQLWLHLLAWPAAAAMTWTLIQTGSRGGLICAGAGLMVYTLRGRSLEHRVRNVVLGLIAVGVLAFAAWQTPMMRARFERTAEEGNMAGREKIYPALLSMLKEKPVIGWGPLANQYEVAARMADPGRARRDAHNLMLELLTATGVLGWVPFMIGLVLAAQMAWRGRHGRLGMIPIAVLMTMLVGTLSGTWIAAKIFWVAVALAIAAGLYWSRPVPQELR